MCTADKKLRVLELPKKEFLEVLAAKNGLLATYSRLLAEKPRLFWSKHDFLSVFNPSRFEPFYSKGSTFMAAIWAKKIKIKATVA